MSWNIRFSQAIFNDMGQERGMNSAQGRGRTVKHNFLGVRLSLVILAFVQLASANGLAPPICPRAGDKVGGEKETVVNVGEPE